MCGGVIVVWVGRWTVEVGSVVGGRACLIGVFEVKNASRIRVVLPQWPWAALSLNGEPVTLTNEWNEFSIYLL